MSRIRSDFAHAVLSLDDLSAMTFASYLILFHSFLYEDPEFIISLFFSFTYLGSGPKEILGSQGIWILEFFMTPRMIDDIEDGSATCIYSPDLFIFSHLYLLWPKEDRILEDEETQGEEVVTLTLENNSAQGNQQWLFAQAWGALS